MSWETARDIVIVIYGLMGIIFLVVLVFAVLFLAFAVRALSRKVQMLLDDPVRPTLNEAQQTMRNVRGASEFLADNAVHPVIRTVAMVRGARRGIGALTSLRRR